MTKLTALDNMFLLMDNPEQKMHILAYVTFEKPRQCAENYVEKLVEEIRQNPWPLPHYNQRLHRSVRTLGRYHWVNAQEVDMNHHVRFVRLSGIGSAQEIRDYTTDLHSISLDYNRPLWEIHVLDGLENKDEFALVVKVHHCSIDGVSARNVMEEVFKTDPNDVSNADMAAKKMNQKRHSNRRPPIASRAARLKAYWKGLGVIRAQIKSGETMLIPPAGAVPVTRFNQIVAPTRSFSTTSLTLNAIAEIARVTRSTINDIVSAIVGTGLRRYLEEKGESVKKSLYATMPISLHTEDDLDQSNRISFCAYSLGTDMTSPGEQINVIRQATERAKKQIGGVPQSVLYSLMGVRILTLIYKRLRGIREVNPRTMTNVLISNVPLFKEARYYKGSKLLGIYPLSLVMDGIGINITVSSYLGNLVFGLASDKTKAPDIEKIGDHMQDAFDAMRAAILNQPLRKEAWSS